MRYKILIARNSRSTVDDFFLQMDDVFECQSTSVHSEDILSHIKYFSPDAFVYITYNVSPTVINKLADLKEHLTCEGIPLILICNQKDYNDLAQASSRVSDLILSKPLSIAAIRKNVVSYLDGLKKSNSEIAEQKRRKEDELYMRLEQDREKLNPPQRKHILVVDDDPMMLKLIKRHLEEKYDVATAVNGNIALRFLETKKTDMVLLDYEMPVVNGPFILSKIRTHEATKDLPVVFLTGVADKGKIMNALSMNPQGYLLKPIEREKLLQTIESIIG